jgi:RNA polymerase sigma factor (sigma-70 family)
MSSDKKPKRLTKKEEAKIIHQCLKKNNWENFIRQYLYLIRAFIIKTFNKKNYNYAFEAVEILEIKVLQKFVDGALKKYNPKEEMSLSGWIILITVRTTLNYIKQEIRRKELVPIDENSDGPDLVPGADSRFEEFETKQSILSLAREILPPREQEVFLLFFIEHMQPDEIADYLNISISSVNAALSRAKNRLIQNSHLFTDLLEH